MTLYRDVECLLHTRQQQEGWGSGVIPKLACDIVKELLDTRGFSERDLKRMLRFFREVALGQGVNKVTAEVDEKVPQAAALLPWGAVSNFELRLPEAQSELVQQQLNDPYIFDFLTIAEPFREREHELGLLRYLEAFLLELGDELAFVGRHIARASKRRVLAGEPALSVDTKKKELVGPYRNRGKEYRKTGDPETVKTHDLRHRRKNCDGAYG